MKRLLFRFKVAFVAWRAAFLKPELMFSKHFELMANIYDVILKVQVENRPMMFQVGLILPDDEMHTIATVWVGAGVNSSPMGRLTELLDENAELKRLLEQKLSDKHPNSLTNHE